MVFSELGSVLFVVFGFFVFGEAIGAVGAIGATVVFIGATLVAITEDRKFNKRLVPAMIAVIMWSSGFIVLSYSISASGTLAIPIIITRISSLVFFFAAARFMGFKKTETKAIKHIKGLFATGLLDGIGVIGFGFASVLAAVGLSGVMNATAPVIAAIIGYKYYKERFTGLQLFGFAIMIIGAVAVSVS